MSYYHVPTARKRLKASYLFALLALVGLAASLASGWSATRPISITVEGEHQRVVSGTTVRDLARNGMLSATAGNLVAVDGSIIETAAGGPALVNRNGMLAGPSQRVAAGDVLESVSGSDRRESLLVTDTVIPYESVFEGEGPIIGLKQLGNPGLKRVTMGARSGIEVTSTVLTEALDTIFVHTRPRLGDKVVALTFDDGPVKGQTDRVLNVLKREEVPATFFFVGSYAKTQPDLVRRTKREGHQIANHTYSHPKLTGRSGSFVRKEIVQGNQALKSITGSNTQWFRPPYGALDATAWQELQEFNQKVVLWDVDPSDWRRPGVDAIVDNVVSSVQPGSVVLLHDGGGDRRQTIKALPLIIEKLRDEGYIFVTLEDLASAK